MSPSAPLLAFVATFALSALALRLLVPWLKARRILDIPNERSSHVTVTPRGGGIAPVAVLAAAGAVAGILAGAAWALIFAGLAAALCLMFFVDDRRSLGVGVRLGAQLAAALAAWGLVIAGWPAPLGGVIPVVVLVPLLIVGWLWFINLYNFMDGIDGISGVETASIGAGAALVALLAAAEPAGLGQAVIVAGMMLAGAGAGFLTANWHPAKVFLGDAGSVPLGFLGGGLMIALAALGQPAAALILPAYYVVDATTTLLRRLARGEKVWLAHRQHAYQTALAGGLDHAAVCWRLIGLNTVLILLAVVSIRQPALALGVAYLAAFGLYGALMMRGGARTPP
jgi:UDP-N-acetylmuramyl pentapeptide phosphotransferase/UDP-N-acetylglucosamine-1-phosphate transferase